MNSRRSLSIFLCRLAALVAIVLLIAPATAALAAKEKKVDDQLLAKRYQMARATYHNLTDSNNKLGSGSELPKLLKQFQAIYDANPDHTLAPACLFMLGFLHEERANLADNPMDRAMAITYYRDLTTRFPRHSLADDALLAMARIYQEAKGDAQAAARTYARLVALYPDGDMYPEAVQLLRKLKGAVVAEQQPSAPHEAEAAEPPSPPTPAKKAAAPAAPVSIAEMAVIEPLKHWSTDDYTRIVIETSKPVAFKKSLLPKNGNLPRRLYVDLDNCRVTPGYTASIAIDDGLLKQVRSAQFSPETVRVVLDIESISDHKIFSLENPFRVVIDVKGDRPVTTAKAVPAAPAPTKTPGKVSPAKPMPDAPSLAQQLGLGVKRVVIDPGHGGKDPGAVGPDGLLEKDVTLAVALNAAAILRQNLHCEVVLTRDRDVFVPLEERTAIANTNKGDLFISIHVNAAPTPKATGIETYFLDLARTSDAMQVAARENATSAGQMSNLQAILMDLIQSTKVNESAKLAECVQANMISGLSNRYQNVKNLGVKRAPFVVLIGAQMPSVLTEIAFLSNPAEAQRLRDPQYLADVAQELVSGVSRYAGELNVASLLPQ
ncbi:MAG: N-acetylmuramoyl-L-alanine amidase [Desulfobulbaceae bacterium]|nr:N-acetylmuramoyl-L-alanine amidase [Desulfobulbaceae bacterium]